MRITCRYELNFERSYHYLREHLASGASLSNTVLNEVDLHKGSFFTILPQNAALERLYHFEHGGIIPAQPYGHTKHYAKGLKKWILPREIETVRPEVGRFIYQFITTEPQRYVLMEDAITKAGDPHLSIEHVQLALCGEDVYYLLQRTNSLDEVLYTFARVSHSWHSLAILASGEATQLSQLSQKDLSHCCTQAAYIIIGAYDGEGYLFWERKVALDMEIRTL